tara:strand:- start:416 stop:535 length:120 start_codon:yes stop_codon:yes gene_type:complete
VGNAVTVRRHAGDDLDAEGFADGNFGRFGLVGDRGAVGT